jgi:hypothetical protein
MLVALWILVRGGRLRRPGAPAVAPSDEDGATRSGGRHRR